jgi:hypothetical protein
MCSSLENNDIEHVWIFITCLLGGRKGNGFQNPPILPHMSIIKNPILENIGGFFKFSVICRMSMAGLTALVSGFVGKRCFSACPV